MIKSINCEHNYCTMQIDRKITTKNRHTQEKNSNNLEVRKKCCIFAPPNQIVVQLNIVFL